MPSNNTPLTNAQLSALHKQWWTPSRKAELKALAEANGGDYGAATKQLWDQAGAVEEFKHSYNAAIA
jgi:hypothetical protein